MTRNPIQLAALRAFALAGLLLLTACPTQDGAGNGSGQAQVPVSPAAGKPAASAELPGWAKDPERAVLALVGDFRGFQEPCR